MHSWFRSPSVESKKEIYAEKIVKTFLSFKKFFARISNTVNFKKSEFNGIGYLGLVVIRGQ